MIRFLLVASSTCVLCVIFATIWELKEYQICLSPDALRFFLTEFYWGKEYISAFIAIFTIVLAFNTYQRNIADKREKAFEQEIEKVKNDNPRIYYTYKNQEIISEITKKYNRIQSDRQLGIYFNRYVRDHICSFERCSYNNDCENKRNCTGGCCYGQDSPTYNDYRPTAHSLQSFQIIARELFCISSEYAGYSEKLEELYNNAAIPTTDCS